MLYKLPSLWYFVTPAQGDIGDTKNATPAVLGFTRPYVKPSPTLNSSVFVITQNQQLPPQYSHKFLHTFLTA